jgi:phosphatidate cytidylyltransferase
MKTRVMTSVVYVAILLALIALKWLIPTWGALGFDVLFCVVSIIGCIELLRASEGVSYAQKVVTIAFCAVAVPIYVAVQMPMQGQGFLAVGCAGCIYAFILAGLSIFKHEDCTVKGMMTCIFAMLYCGVLSVMLSAVNHLVQNSVAAIIVLFFTVNCTDTGAYLIGSLLKKFFPWKLAPKLSPNKTIVGGIGGLVGGMIGAIAAYYVYYFLGGVIGTELVYTSTMPAVVAFMLIGLITAIFAQLGDLFESAIKREYGIKDMGKLLPGHGGMLDRFDSLLFSSVIVLFSFGVILI